MAEKRIDLDEFKSDTLLEIKKVAEILQVNSKTVLRLINDSGELRAIRVGERWRVRQEDLEEYIQSHLHYKHINPDGKIKSIDTDSDSNESQKKEGIDLEGSIPNQAILNDQVDESVQRRKGALITPPFDEAKLPMPPYFVGRDADLHWLLEQLGADKLAYIASLRGMGGIGKTALASKAVHQLRQEGRFCDGIVFVDCRDFKHDDVSKILQAILSRFDAEHRSPETKDLADLAEAILQLLVHKDVLIVIDNIEPDLDIEKIVTPLHAAGATLLLTSRQALPYTVVPVNASYTLGLLSTDEALDLFAFSFGRDSVAQLNHSEYAAAERIVRALDRHTLAVKLAGAYAAHLSRDLKTLARELEDPQRAFELSFGDVPPELMRVFMQSILELPADEQRLFAALATFASGEFARNAALALAKDLNLSKPEANLEQLVLLALVDASVNTNMPEIGDKERLHQHPLLRALSVKEFMHWSEEEQESAFNALASYYATYISKLLGTSFNLDESSESVDHSDVNIVLEQDIMNITHLLQWLLEHEQGSLMVAICSGLQYFWFERGDTELSLRYLPKAVEASKKIHVNTNKQFNPLYIADMLLSYGRVLQYNGQLDEANRYYQERLEVAQKMQDKRGESDALHYLGRLARQLGELRDAEEYYERAFKINHEIGNQQSESWTLAFLGQIQQDRGNLEQAEALYKQALAIQQKLKQRRAEGWFLGYLGRLALDRGQLVEAREYYERHLDIALAMQDRRSEGVCYSFLGQIKLSERKDDDAEELLQKALSILHGVDVQSEGWVYYFLGQMALDLEQFEQAKQYSERALSIFQIVHDLRGESLVLTQLSIIAERQGDLDSAENLHRESLEICSKSHYRQIIAYALLELGRFLIEKRDDRKQGCSMIHEAIQHYKDMKLPYEKEAQKIARELECNA